MVENANANANDGRRTILFQVHFRRVLLLYVLFSISSDLWTRIYLWLWYHVFECIFSYQCSFCVHCLYGTQSYWEANRSEHSSRTGNETAVCALCEVRNARILSILSQHSHWRICHPKFLTTHNNKHNNKRPSHHVAMFLGIIHVPLIILSLSPCLPE